MEKVIPWDIGGGNIHLSYYGTGNGSIVVVSDTDNFTGKTRSKTTTVSTIKGKDIRVSLTIKQFSKDAFKGSDGLAVIAKDGLVFAAKNNNNGKRI